MVPTIQDLIMVASENTLVGRDRKELPSRISSSSLVRMVRMFRMVRRRRKIIRKTI